VQLSFHWLLFRARGVVETHRPLRTTLQEPGNLSASVYKEQIATIGANTGGDIDETITTTDYSTENNSGTMTIDLSTK